MEKVVIALDAMGGDYAPEQTVKALWKRSIQVMRSVLSL